MRDMRDRRAFHVLDRAAGARLDGARRRIVPVHVDTVTNFTRRSMGNSCIGRSL